MRHRVAHRKLGRVTEHRLAMLRNLATALLQHEHIETTVARAKELRPFAEQLITVAKRGIAKGGPADVAEAAKACSAAQMVPYEVSIAFAGPRYQEAASSSEGPIRNSCA